MCVWRRQRQAKPSDANAKATTANQRRREIGCRRWLVMIQAEMGKKLFEIKIQYTNFYFK